MLRSRRAFLDAGHYAPLGEELAAIAREVDATRFVDAGCGDGTFTAHFVAGIGGRWREGWGIDIARAAAEMAARRHPGLEFAVASVHDLPFLDGSATCVLNAFAPSEPREFRRVLDPAGTLVTVRPGDEHLVELRRLLYRELRAPGRAIAIELVAFEPVAQRELRYRSTLSAEDVHHLLGMTPYAGRTNCAARQAIGGEAPLQVTAHFLVTIFRPRL
jgi:23S rRNA (guanine745-N1)-methyltransferase